MLTGASVWHRSRPSVFAYALTPGATPDVSPGFVDTWAFLDRRIADVMSAGKAVGELTQAASTWLEGQLRAVKK